MVLLAYSRFGQEGLELVDQLEVGGLAAVLDEEGDHFQGLEEPLVLHRLLHLARTLDSKYFCR